MPKLGLFLWYAGSSDSAHQSTEWRGKPLSRHQCRSHCLRWRWAGHCTLGTIRCCWWELPTHPQIFAGGRYRPSKETSLTAKFQQGTLNTRPRHEGSLRRNYLDSVFRIIATSVHIEARVHAAAEVSPLGNGAGDREADQRGVVNAAFIEGPVTCGLNWVGPELKHPGGNQSQQHQGEQGDVVYAVLGFHPRDERRAPRAVFPRGVHVWKLCPPRHCKRRASDQWQL